MKKHIIILVLIVSLVFLANAQDTIKVACVGNSITEGIGTVTFPSQLGLLLGDSWDVRNFGISSRTLLKKGDYPYWDEQIFIDAMNFQPDKVIIMLGTNDSKYFNWQYHEDFFSDYAEMIDSFANLASNPEIWICYPIKSHSDLFNISDSVIKFGINPLIDSVATEKSVNVIDLYGPTEDKPGYYMDGIHPSTVGNNYIAKILFEVLTGEPIQYVNDENMALNKIISSVGYIDNNPPELLIDGNLSTKWSFGSFPAWVILDLGEIDTIDNFQLLFQDSKENGYQYTIESSENSTNWQMLKDQTNRTDTIAAYSCDTISPKAMRYIRLTITSLSNSTDGNINLYEFKALKYNGYKHGPVSYAQKRNDELVAMYFVPPGYGTMITIYGTAADGEIYALRKIGTKLMDDVLHLQSGDIGTTYSFYSSIIYNSIEINSDKVSFYFAEPLPSAYNLYTEKENIKVFPNPFTNEINITGIDGEFEIKIFDISGKLIRSFSNINQEHQNGYITWDGTDNNNNIVFPGIYICDVKTSDRIFQKKIIFLNE